MPIFTSRSSGGTGSSFGLSLEGRLTNTRFWPGLGAEDIHEVHGCCAGPFEAPGHSCTQLLGRLVDYVRHMIIYDYDRCIDDRLGRSL